MKKLFSIIFLFAFIGIKSQSSITPLNLWQTSGNALGNNNKFIGPVDNRSLLFKTNNAQRFKIDSLGAVRLYTSTATPTLNGSFYYGRGTGAGNEGFVFYTDDATNSANAFTIKNSSNYLSLYQDHGINNWLYVKRGSDFVISVDDANSQAYDVSSLGHSWALPSNTVTGSNTPFRWTSPLRSNITASTESPNFILSTGGNSQNYNTGALARFRSIVVTQPLITFVGSSTLTEGASMAIDGPLRCTTNGTCTNSSGLNIGGIVPTALTTAVINAYGLSVTAPTGAQNNYAATLKGRVGIGTAAPSATLDVVGTMSVSSTSTTNGITNTGALSTSTTFSCGTTSTLTGAVRAVSNLSVAGTFSAGSTSTLVGNATFSAGINSSVSQSVVAASTSGSITVSQPFQGTSYKKVIIYCNAALGTASYTFPTAFTQIPMIITSNQVGAAVVTALSTTAMTLTGATTTGFLTIEGY